MEPLICSQSSVVRMDDDEADDSQSAMDEEDSILAKTEVPPSSVVNNLTVSNLQFKITISHSMILCSCYSYQILIAYH